VTLRDTPWVDTSFAKLWERIEAASPRPEWMPIRRPGERVTMKEYGCGYYGCVMPTSDPTVVCKLTTDVTEAVFVAALLSIPRASRQKAFVGMVRYHAIYELPREEVPLPPAGRNPEGRIFVLWRDSVDEVGVAEDDEQGDANPLRNYNEWAAKLHGYVERFAQPENSGGFDAMLKYLEMPKKMVEQLRVTFKETLDSMAQGSWQRQIANRAYVAITAAYIVKQIPAAIVSIEHPEYAGIRETLRYLYSVGLILGDLHSGNLGYVNRSGQPHHLPELVITDPGHAIPFQSRWTKVKVPVLP